MQIEKRNITYNNKGDFDRFKALGVKQPFANDLISGAKSVEIRNHRTKYRGEVLICSYKFPKMAGYESGSTLGFAELYDIKRVGDFTDEDWEQTRVPKEQRKTIKRGFGWFFKNPRSVVEFPINCKLGLFDLFYTKGMVIEYPKHVKYDI